MNDSVEARESTVGDKGEGRVPIVSKPLGTLLLLLLSITVAGRGLGQESEATSKEARVLESEARVEGRVPRVWWLHPKIEKRLALTAEQKSELDELVRSYAAHRKVIAERRIDINGRMAMAFRTGNFEAARKIAAKFEEFPNESLEEAHLRLDVLSRLNESQLDFLAREHSTILEEPWRGGGYSLVRAGNHPRRGPHGHDAGGDPPRHD